MDDSRHAGAFTITEMMAFDAREMRSGLIANRLGRSQAAERLGDLVHDALDHHCRDAREHGLGHWGRQDIANRVRLWRLPLRLDVATAEHIPELPGLRRRSARTWPSSFGSDCTCRGSVTPRSAARSCSIFTNAARSSGTHLNGDEREFTDFACK